MIFWMSIAFSYSEEDRDSEHSIADFKYPCTNLRMGVNLHGCYKIYSYKSLVMKA